VTPLKALLGDDHRSDYEKLIKFNLYYLLGQTFLTSCNGARSPLAREPDDLYLNDDIAETNLSRVFPDISE